MIKYIKKKRFINWLRKPVSDRSGVYQQLLRVQAWNDNGSKSWQDYYEGYVHPEIYNGILDGLIYTLNQNILEGYSLKLLKESYNKAYEVAELGEKVLDIVNPSADIASSVKLLIKFMEAKYMMYRSLEKLLESVVNN